jgi:protease I
VMIVAHRDFRDEELFTPRKILETAGAKVTVASSDIREASGMLGRTVKPDLLVKDINPDSYDALVFVGGPGAQEYWDDRKAHEIARRAAKGKKIVGAICIAPVTLANAGLLDGKRATVWRTEAGRLRAQGADYTGRDVEVDGNIITANGPEAAEKFGREIVAALGRQPGGAESQAQD